MGQGNYLKSSRKSFYLSSDCCRYLTELAFREGISESSIMELAVRRYYEEIFGDRPWTADPNPRKWG